MEDKKITEQESLQLIQQMINTAKKEQQDDGQGWIIWGWLLFTASVLTIINYQTRWFDVYFFWNAFGLISLCLLLYSVFRYFFFAGKERVKTYTAALFGKLHLGFFITLMIVIIAINRGVLPERGFAILTGLYGFWILVYGAALNFKPSIIGAYVAWAFAVLALFLDDFMLIMACHGAAVLCGYIIPGHMANNEFKKLNRSLTN